MQLMMLQLFIDIGVIEFVSIIMMNVQWNASIIILVYQYDHNLK
jgi:hypothetical protein